MAKTWQRHGKVMGLDLACSRRLLLWIGNDRKRQPVTPRRLPDGRDFQPANVLRLGGIALAARGLEAETDIR